ncbi:MAG: hypothetical protein AAF289_08870 [Cyanobacteria bacterium P01_A01_bin.135]
MTPWKSINNGLEILLTVSLLAALPATAHAGQVNLAPPACATTLSMPISAFPVSVELPQQGEPFRCQDPDWDNIEQED